LSRKYPYHPVIGKYHSLQKSSTMSITTPSPLSLSKESIDKLVHLTTLLHLFHHRNHNQHRRSIWWRHFCLFRRELSQFTAHLASLHSAPTTHLARAQKKTRDIAILATTEKRMTFWRDVLVSKWHHAFSQLVADGRFAVLGLILMAILGEVCALTGITGVLEEMGQIEFERVLEDFGREEWGLEKAGLGGKIEGEDQGEVVLRGEEPEEPKAETVMKPKKKPKSVIAEIRAASSPANDAESREADDATTVPAVSSPAPKSDSKRAREKPTKDLKPAKPSKKKRKKGDAIDDLFNF
jgi:hypothetical protein